MLSFRNASSNSGLVDATLDQIAKRGGGGFAIRMSWWTFKKRIVVGASIAEWRVWVFNDIEMQSCLLIIPRC